MKVYAIGFTKNAIKVLDQLRGIVQNNGDNMSAYLSPRIYEEQAKLNTEQVKSSREEYSSANLSDFTQKAWQDADVIVFVGAAGIAVRAIASYIDKKDQDPAVIVIDEKANFVIPILSGHIGGGNAYAEFLAGELSAEAVITTATDLNQKFAIDTWAAESGYHLESTKNIAAVSSAILEDREVVLFAPKRICQDLSEKYSRFIQVPLEEFTGQQYSKRVLPLTSFTESFEADERMIQEKIKASDAPTVVFSPRLIEMENQVLQIIPQSFFVGMGARKDADVNLAKEFYQETLTRYKIHPQSVISINSIDIKKEEKAILELAKEMQVAKRRRRNTDARIDTDIKTDARTDTDSKININEKTSGLNFFSSEELSRAEEYTDHPFAQSDLVQSVTGAGNVCERAAVLGAAYYAQKTSENPNNIKIEILVEKTKGNGATIAIAQIVKENI